MLHLLASPRFHRIVRRVHKEVEDIRHGRDPNQPLRQGEATGEFGLLYQLYMRFGTDEWPYLSLEPPTADRRGFLHYFIDELKNQIRGTPTNPPPPSPPQSKPKV